MIFLLTISLKISYRMTDDREKKTDLEQIADDATVKQEKQDVIMNEESNDEVTKSVVERMEEDKKDENGDEDDESEEEEAVEVEPLATTRSRRSNAGNLMSKIIQDEDEFYTNIYGGFNDEEEDDDFDEDNDVDSDEVEDEVDSDFSASETDEIAPEFQEIDDEPKRRAGVYRDPKPKGLATAPSGSSASTPAQSKPKPTSSHATPSSPSKNRAERSFRDSTRKKTEETIKNINSGKKRKKLRVTEAPKKLTQEELLEEAKITEEENIRSLEVYQRSESERLKKIKQTKKTLPPPYVSYLSTTMPIIGSDGEKYSRNFVTYVT